MASGIREPLQRDKFLDRVIYIYVTKREYEEHLKAGLEKTDRVGPGKRQIISSDKASPSIATNYFSALEKGVHFRDP
jgi:hypothetical protein